MERLEELVHELVAVLFEIIEVLFDMPGVHLGIWVAAFGPLLLFALTWLNDRRLDRAARKRWEEDDEM